VQWQISTNGGSTFTSISGATSNTYTFTAPATVGTMLYRAVYTNSVGTATSRAASVVVDIAPAVTTSPVSQTANAGNTVTFTVAGSGTPAGNIQWQVSTDHGKTFTSIPFANASTLKFSARAMQNGDEFRAILTNAIGVSVSAPATLTVDFAPVVMTQPLSQSVTSGTSVTLTASASGNPTPAVHWQISVNGGKTFTDITGATAHSLTFTASSAGTDEFRAVFTNSAGTVFSNAAIVTVTA
jgi:hypothetical protein